MIHVLSFSQLKDLFFFMPNNQPSSKIIFGKPASTGKNRRAEHSRDSHHSHRPGIRPFVDGIIENKAADAEKLPQETELLDTFGPKLQRNWSNCSCATGLDPKNIENLERSWDFCQAIGRNEFAFYFSVSTYLGSTAAGHHLFTQFISLICGVLGAILLRWEEL